MVFRLCVLQLTRAMGSREGLLQAGEGLELPCVCTHLLTRPPPQVVCMLLLVLLCCGTKPTLNHCAPLFPLLSLPGIDIAYLLSGAAYHTQTDTLDQIRPGVLQETGQSMTAAIKSLAAALATAAAVPEATDTETSTASAAARQQQPSLQELLEPSDHRRMFTSLAGAAMVTYSSSMARLLHNMPLVLVLTAPHTMQLLAPATVRAGYPADGVGRLCNQP